MATMRILLLLLVAGALSDVNGAADGDLRLALGGRKGAGRAEVYNTEKSEWRTVCDLGPWPIDVNGWPTRFCKDLGFDKALSVSKVQEWVLGPSAGGIAKASPSCAADAANFAACTERKYSCGHDQDVYIDCQGPQDGDLRIRKVGRDVMGRAEMYKNGAFGSICSNDLKFEGWATLFCTQLGFGRPDEVLYTKNKYLATTLGISIQNPTCDVTSETFSACTSAGACAHDKDIYINCHTLPS